VIIGITKARKAAQPSNLMKPFTPAQQVPAESMQQEPHVLIPTATCSDPDNTSHEKWNTDRHSSNTTQIETHKLFDREEWLWDVTLQAVGMRRHDSSRHDALQPAKIECTPLARTMLRKRFAKGIHFLSVFSELSLDSSLAKEPNNLQFEKYEKPQNQRKLLPSCRRQAKV
jgi:hypothetical protein